MLEAAGIEADSGDNLLKALEGKAAAEGYVTGKT
jgi:hypothetical protein